MTRNLSLCGAQPVTICLGLLCENSKKLVAVADRMVSVEFLSLEFEQRTRKVEPLGKQVVALTAGDALAHTELLRKANCQIQRMSQPAISEIANLIESCFIEARQKLAENTILRRAGLDYATFLEEQRNLATDLAFGLMSEYQKVELDLELLILGVDGSGAHLYHIGDPGVTTCFDAIGYAAIGSGLPHAESFLTEADYSPKITLNRAIWLCYVAKRRSERAPGVGKATDVLVIDDKGSRFLNDGIIDNLREIYERYLSELRTVSENVEGSLRGLELTFEEEPQ
ncbi:MAG: hypothetical protein COS88_00755 [Chloroflexi bacterium CG07_land_8_20_14_0_80_51_10]|nr:MAG: hypothetical protein COS88_00755 [Chloroflexi bacterium CG07_land_8_20_14_0_80_51_10]